MSPYIFHPTIGYLSHKEGLDLVISSGIVPLLIMYLIYTAERLSSAIPMYITITPTIQGLPREILKDPREQ
jgi:hypothetical protein